jgi:hypothetical protein
MNFQFDVLATRLRESAAEAARQATEAARGMTNLEAMAEKDAYIHSGDDSSIVDYHHHDDDNDNSTISTHESAWLRQSTTTVSVQPATTTTTTTARRFPTVLSAEDSFETSAVKNTNGNCSIPLKVSVLERRSTSPIGSPSSSSSKSNAHIQNASFHNTYEADHSSDDEEDDDPIFTLLRSQRKHQETDPLSLHSETSRSGQDSQQQQMQHSSSDPNGAKQPRKQHRFLTELDTRMAAEQKPLPDLLPPIPKQNLATALNQQQQSPWLSLGSLKIAGGINSSNHANTASMSNTQTTATTIPIAPLSRIRQQTYWNRSQVRLDNHHTEDWEHVALVSSSAVLGKEEMQALATLHSPSPSSIVSIVTAHPKEAFIALTLLLAAYAYFHSRTYT